MKYQKKASFLLIKLNLVKNEVKSLISNGLNNHVKTMHFLIVFSMHINRSRITQFVDLTTIMNEKVFTVKWIYLINIPPIIAG